jgi:hypothetical protein
LHCFRVFGLFPSRFEIHVGVFVSTLALGVAAVAGYEVVEWFSNSLAGTHLAKSINDTATDLLEDTRSDRWPERRSSPSGASATGQAGAHR